MKLQNVTVVGAVGGNENVFPNQKSLNFTTLQVNLHAMNVEVNDYLYIFYLLIYYTFFPIANNFKRALFKTFYIKWPTLQVRLDGLNLDRDVVDSLQSLVDSFDSSAALEPAKKVVNIYVAQEILNLLNRIVQNFSVEQIKSYLLAR